MDRKTLTIMMGAKYGGYLIVLWIVVNFGSARTAVLAALTLALAVDAIRGYYLNERHPVAATYSIFAQYGLVVTFALLEQSGIAIVLYVILVAESVLAFPWRIGNLVFGLSLVSFALGGVGIGLSRGLPLIEAGSMAGINSIFLVFVYGVSYMARRQSEETQRAEAAVAELRASRSELARAHQELLLHSRQQERMAVSEERNRIAREVHDTVAHSLTTVVVGMEAAKRLMDRDVVRAYAEIEKSQEQARRGLDDLRRSVRALRPRALDEAGLRDAIGELVRDYATQGVQVDLSVQHDIHIPEDYELALFRVIQESMTNAVRHGMATHIQILLGRSDSEALRLEIHDNGTGCDGITEGSGLRGIRERIEALGGSVRFLPRGEDGASGFSVISVIEGVPR